MTYHLNQLTEKDLNILFAAREAYGYTYKEAFELLKENRFTLHEGMSLQEVAVKIAHRIMGDRNSMNFYKKYFDYEAFARDLSKEGYTETQYGVIAEDRI